PSGTGTGEFSVTVTGLTEGESYYARSYATNSAGIAYGNCIEFTATSTVGVGEDEIIGMDLNIYPNPASVLTTFSFHVESTESMVLTVIDLKGRVVFHRNLGILPHGENQVMLDLSGLQNGMYTCQLSNGQSSKVTRKLVIVH
ncbi:MAG: T9SS type A sorting domain-containing protein, partial [Bacteroidales bacterium]|nr:T9SS type A sorting domain-containing protein [Bacteroidales bacterium]